jgi:hypothetical protein
MWLRKPKQLTSEFFQLIEQDEQGGEQIVLMQYTGLKDKNGVEIYEGDILKAPYFQTAAVEYMESGFWCKQGKHNMLPNLTDAEVIGNIYENPELLKS